VVSLRDKIKADRNHIAEYRLISAADGCVYFQRGTCFLRQGISPSASSKPDASP